MRPTSSGAWSPTTGPTSNHDGRLWRDKDHDGTVDNVALRRHQHRRRPDPRLRPVRGAARRVRAVHLHQPGDERLHEHGPLASEAHEERPVRRLLPQPGLGGRSRRRTSTSRSSSTRTPTGSGCTRRRPARGSFNGEHLRAAAARRSVCTTARSSCPGTARSPSSRLPSPSQRRPSRTRPGQLTESLTFGGSKVDAAQRDRLYNNGSVYDAKDWGWRAESGDWRFFYFDVPTAPPAGTQFLAKTDFAGPSPHNDLDTLVFGPTTNSYQLADGSDPIFAPYVLGTVGASQNTNVGAGVWEFDTATGTNQELISAPAAEGLHALVQHEVNFQHDNGEVHMPFEATIGSATVSPDHVDMTVARRRRLVRRDLHVGDRPRRACGRRLRPQPARREHRDGAPRRSQRPDNGKREEVLHAGSRRSRHHLDRRCRTTTSTCTCCATRTATVTFTEDEIVAASAGGTGDESISLVNPPDGDYQVWVHGFAVSRHARRSR